MAGDWIKMRSNLWDDPRVLRLCDETESSENEVIGALYWLWASADQHSVDGTMPGMTLRAIDRKCNVKGLAAALVMIGWIEEYEGGVRLARFTEHNGESAKRRSVDAKRKANDRKTSEPARTKSGHAEDDLREISELEKEKEKEKEKEGKSTPLVTSQSAGDLFDDPFDLPPPPARVECPHKEIIALYHEILPQCPRVRIWTQARQQNLRQRWNDDPRHQSLDFWRTFFEGVRSCDFLVGRSKSSARPWIADLEWMIKSANFTKIIEGNYEN